jgi:hypothetical protein
MVYIRVNASGYSTPITLMIGELLRGQEVKL